MTTSTTEERKTDDDAMSRTQRNCRAKEEIMGENENGNKNKKGGGEKEKTRRQSS